MTFPWIIALAAGVIGLTLNVWTSLLLAREWRHLTATERRAQVCFVWLVPVFGAIAIGALHAPGRWRSPTQNPEESHPSVQAGDQGCDGFGSDGCGGSESGSCSD